MRTLRTFLHFHILLIFFFLSSSLCVNHGPLLWSDEFDYIGPPNPAKWTSWNFIPGLLISNAFTDNNAFVDGNYLTMTLKKEAVNGMNYTGSNLVTKEGFRYGYYEMRAKIARVQGQTGFKKGFQFVPI